MRLNIGVLFFLQTLTAQQSDIRVTNAASHGLGSAPDATIAPGSLIIVEVVIQGGILAYIDPAAVILQIQPGGSVQVIGSSGPAGVIGRLSGDTPVGPASLIVTIYGQAYTPAPVNIVPASFGLFTRNSGLGPVLAQNSLTHPAKPGDFVTLWGTGLGSASGQTASVTVLLGGHRVATTYAGPAPGFPATDQINFQVPDDPAIPSGCYVAVAVQAGAYTSNLGMLSTSTDGNPCNSPFGFTADQLSQLDAGKSVNLGQVNLYNMVGPPPSPSHWFNLDGFARMESANAMFLTMDAVNVAQMIQPLKAEDFAYDCTRSTGAVGAFLNVSQNLSAGDRITLTKDASSLDLLSQAPQFSSFYSAQLPQTATVDSPDKVPPPFFSPGTWQVSASGSTNLQAFTGPFPVPSPVRILNAASLGTIDHTQDLTLTWNGSDYSNNYTAIVQLAAPSAGVVCTVSASAGQLTIPSALLPSVPQATLELLLVPRSDPLALLTVPLTDGTTMPVVLRYYPSEVIPVQIQ